MQNVKNPETILDQSRLSEIWMAHHRYLIDIAYRMLGSVSEAEDIVQEAFTRLLRVDVDQIQDARGWLVVAVTRLCLDQLRSARSRREVYVGPWLPEPVIPAQGADGDPAERVTLDDTVRMALMLVLERLSPAERAAFVLHDVFQFSFEEISQILDRSPAACRQLASRARRQVRNEAPPARFEVDAAELNQVTLHFIDAASTGNLESLMNVLDPNVVGHADSGGLVTGPRHPIAGREKVAKVFTGFIKRAGVRLAPMPINGDPGVLAFQGDRLIGAIALSIENGRIVQLHGVGNPLKLAYAAAMLNVETRSPDRDRLHSEPSKG